MIATNQPEAISETLASQAAELVGNLILTGELAPDERLHIKDLAKRTGIGVTPLREGLSRLLSRGLVIPYDQRGFRVAPMSRADLQDIIDTRLPLETEALRRSIAFGDDHWEGQVVATLHRLTRFMTASPMQMSTDARQFDEVHKAFHTALVSACRSPRMLQILNVLYDNGLRYRRMILTNSAISLSQSKRRIAEHKEIADAALARNPEQATKFLRQHLASFPEDVFSGDDSTT